MTQSKKIAVTGGIGSGKSTVLALLRDLRYPVFSCDEIYRELCSEPQMLALLEGRFPGCVKEGRLDRKVLSAMTFGDAAALNALNALTHPRIMERLLAKMEPYSLSFAEVPLLFEGGYEGMFDGVIAVLRDKDARVSSVAARDGLSEEEILLRMARQYDYTRLPPGCGVLYNNGDEAALRESLRSLLKRYCP